MATIADRITWDGIMLMSYRIQKEIERIGYLIKPISGLYVE